MKLSTFATAALAVSLEKSMAPKATEVSETIDKLPPLQVNNSQKVAKDVDAQDPLPKSSPNQMDEQGSRSKSDKQVAKKVGPTQSSSLVDTSPEDGDAQGQPTDIVDLLLEANEVSGLKNFKTQDFDEMDLDLGIDALLNRNLSADEGEELKRAFSKFDTNNDRFISKHELSTKLKSLGGKVDQHIIDKSFKDADKNGDGKVSFNEFAKATKDSTKPPPVMTNTSQWDNSIIKQVAKAFKSKHFRSYIVRLWKNYIKLMKYKKTFDQKGHSKKKLSEMKKLSSTLHKDLNDIMKGMDYIGEFNGRMERALGSYWFKHAKDADRYLSTLSKEQRQAVQTMQPGNKWWRKTNWFTNWISSGNFIKALTQKNGKRYYEQASRFCKNYYEIADKADQPLKNWPRHY